MIYADRVLLAELAAMNQRMGQETVALLEALNDGYLPAEGLDALGDQLIELGGQLRRRAADVSQPTQVVEGLSLPA